MIIQLNNTYPPILIYQMGKVGSSSIRKSLQNLNLQNPIAYIHYLSWSSIQSVEQYYLKQSTSEVPSHIQFSKEVRKMIDQFLGKIRFKIISLVRDPVARDISSTFQNIEIGLPQLLNMDTQKATDEVITYLVNAFKKFDESQDEVCTWFDNEIRDIFQFDIFSIPFNTSRGYQIYSTLYSDILVIRLENLIECCQEAFYKFLGIQNFSLLNENTGKKKWYADIYQKTLSEIIIPEKILKKIYQSRFSKHFYTDLERSNFIQKWMNISSDIIKNNTLQKEIDQAETEFQKGNIVKAIEILLAINNKQPDNTRVLNDLAVIHWNIGEKNLAIQYIKMSYKIDPFNKKIVHNYLRMLLDTGHRQEAKKIINSYLKQYPDDIDTSN